MYCTWLVSKCGEVRSCLCSRWPDNDSSRSPSYLYRPQEAAVRYPPPGHRLQSFPQRKSQADAPYTATRNQVGNRSHRSVRLASSRGVEAQIDGRRATLVANNVISRHSTTRGDLGPRFLIRPRRSVNRKVQGASSCPGSQLPILRVSGIPLRPLWFTPTGTATCRTSGPIARRALSSPNSKRCRMAGRNFHPCRH